jgi:hypothetical protein
MKGGARKGANPSWKFVPVAEGSQSYWFLELPGDPEEEGDYRVFKIVPVVNPDASLTFEIWVGYDPNTFAPNWVHRVSSLSEAKQYAEMSASKYFDFLEELP